MRLHQVDVFGGLRADGYVLINSSHSFDELGLDEFSRRHRSERLRTVPATELAREYLGRPLPNAALLGGFAALSGQISMAAIARAIRDRFSGATGEGNVTAAERAYALVAQPAEVARV